ncbi:DM13 domain-containing protein [Streptomyces sp. NBC_00199]|uniref:DM13 domain-containing protein n=1 Tax=Streptomyces sp. NBC_00199 TaxID=2975678 RepID=UPI002256990A|nr:DM13 domain-containing protein [Streptomyces sp. NBC_00199]MCX5264086.1 DM13 domain-containing protein [Streptomyces sp. NBC_00199]
MGRVRKALARLSVIAVLVVALGGVGFGLYWFQPWKLWQDETVEEALPGVVEVSAPASVTPSYEPAEQPSATGPQTLASGELISHEHATSGTAKLVRLADGSHVLRLENLDTSNGPDLRVWLTDAPVKKGTAGWRVFDDGKHISLGRLKGNKGSQNYVLPRDVDPSSYNSVSIWCDRFDVSFGAAELTRV